MQKTLDDLIQDVITTFKSYDTTGIKPWNYKTAAFDLQYQVGSLAKRILQLDKERYAEGLSHEDIKSKIADELADIIANTLFVANNLNIDIGTAWQQMLESDAGKVKERS